MKSLSIPRSLVIAAAAALAGLGSIGIAYATVSNIFQYTTTQTGYLSLDPMAFSPKGKTDAAHYGINGPFWIEKDVSALSVCMVAPVNLPEGARITSLKAWASADADQAVQVTLTRVNLALGGGANVVAALISHDTSQNRFAMTTPAHAAVATINNEHYGYGLEVCIVDSTANALFYAARITYTYTTAGS